MTGQGLFRVVLADDIEDWRVLLETEFTADGRFEVVSTATQGAEAVESVRQACPDLAVLDLAMPVMDGLEAIAQIRVICPTTKLLALTAVGSGSGRRALELGADAYLKKQPENLRRLTQVAADLCHEAV